jgi:hypothetical protein
MYDCHRASALMEAAMSEDQDNVVVSIEPRLRPRRNNPAKSPKLRLLVARAMNAPASLSNTEIRELAANLLVFIEKASS